ncbi:hypothetical protein BH09BAC5_BH09BAC5_15410 [soil metagenome]
MIQYETARSPFFEANKNFCEDLIAKLKVFDAEFSGFCNSFGYDIETSFAKNGLSYKLKFHKHQSTQNGVVVPINAIDCSDSQILVSGFNQQVKLFSGKSKWRRLFCNEKIKKQLPLSWYVNCSFSPKESFMNAYSAVIIDNQIECFDLKHGTLTIKMNHANPSPEKLLSDLEAILTSPNFR